VYNYLLSCVISPTINKLNQPTIPDKKRGEPPHIIPDLPLCTIKPYYIISAKRQFDQKMAIPKMCKS